MKSYPEDTWFSKCIRRAADWNCEKCGRSYTEDAARGLDCSHIYPRGMKSVRWCKENALALCMTCHGWYHSQPTESGDWVKAFVGPAVFESLTEKKNIIYRTNKAIRKEIAAHYKAEYNRMISEDSYTFTSWQ